MAAMAVIVVKQQLRKQNGNRPEDKLKKYHKEKAKSMHKPEQNRVYDPHKDR